MPELNVVDKKGKDVGKVSLDDAMFAEPASDHLVWEVVNFYRDNQRVGTHKVKSRGEVRGGGRKPWRQKGTGRARHGSIRSPIWKGGGTTHGPTPRDHGSKMPRRKKQVALRRVLGDLLEEGAVLVVDDLALETHKTKDLAAILESLGAPAKTLIVDDAPGDNLLLASRNLPRVSVVRAVDLNAYDLLLHEHMTITRAAWDHLEKAVAP